MIPRRKPPTNFDLKDFLEKTNTHYSTSSYRVDQPIFSQGDIADAVFYIKKGRIKLAVVSKQGKEAVVAILGQDSFFGEGSLAGQPFRMSAAIAISQCSIVRLEKAAVVRLLRDQPEFSRVFLTHLLSRSMKIEEDLIDQLFNSSEKRLARVLLLLANFGKEGKAEESIPSMTHETLAQIIGSTRSRVSFFMNRFRKLGLIEYNGTLKINSSLLNIILHPKPK